MTRHRKKKRHHASDAPQHEIPVAVAPAVVTVTPSRPAHSVAVTPEPKKKSIGWKAAEFHYIEKDYLWYTGVVAAGAVLGIFALWQRNFFFAVFIVIATTLVVEFGKHRPRTLEYELTDKTINIEGKVYARYEDLKSFHIRKRLGFLDEIVFHRNSKISPFIHLPADDKLALRAREFLLEYIPEEEHKQSMAEIIAERIGF